MLKIQFDLSIFDDCRVVHFFLKERVAFEKKRIGHLHAR